MEQDLYKMTKEELIEELISTQELLIIAQNEAMEAQAELEEVKKGVTNGN